MTAILRSYISETSYSDKLVEIDNAHCFEAGPYVDTVPFAVGSNQTILPVDYFTEAELKNLRENN